MPAAHRIHPQDGFAAWTFWGLPSFSSQGRSDKSLPHRGLWLREQLVAGALFYPAPPIEHRHAFAPAGGHGEVMADQQQGTAQFTAESAQLRHHLTGHGHVQACGGFVGNEQRRFEGDGQGDG